METQKRHHKLGAGNWARKFLTFSGSEIFGEIFQDRNLPEGFRGVVMHYITGGGDDGLKNHQH